MTPTDICLVTLSAAALHRLWNYEEVFAPARRVLEKVPYIRKPLLCPACNAFWFLVAAVLLWMFTPPSVLVACAGYGAIRLMTVVWPKLDAWAKPAAKQQQPPKAPQQQTQQPVKPAAQKKYDRIVVLLTALNDFRDYYSVAVDVLHQARAMAMTNPNWQIQVWMSQQANGDKWKDMPENTAMVPIVPRIPWRKDYQDEGATKTLLDFMNNTLAKMPKDTVVIEHDLMFVSWYIPFAQAMHQFADTNDLLWFHVPHSMPGKRENSHISQTSLPKGRHFIAPVAIDGRDRFAVYYDTAQGRVIPVPSVFDPRVWGDVSKRVSDIVTKTKLWEYDFVQIFPACATRLEAKGFSNIVNVFAKLNKNSKAFLLVCSPNASPDLNAYAHKRAKDLGLSNMALTAELIPDSNPYGLSGAEIKTLMQDYGNVFVFPSISESDSRVCMEARLCRQLVVGNDDVPALHHHADILVPFGTTPAVNESACEFAVNRIIERASRWRSRHSARHLEGIGDLWQKAIAAARL